MVCDLLLQQKQVAKGEKVKPMSLISGMKKKKKKKLMRISNKERQILCNHCKDSTFFEQKQKQIGVFAQCILIPSFSRDPQSEKNLLFIA